jgi:hypothetical protein
METVEMRAYGDATRPTLIYLPGLHADWTLVGSFRAAIADKVRFVEFAYPPIASSLEQYAIAVLDALIAAR